MSNRALTRLSVVRNQLIPTACNADNIRFEPLPGLSFGARVIGCDILTDLDDPASWAKVRKAWLDYGLLVLPQQLQPDGSLLTPEQQATFASRFGKVDHQLQVTNMRKDGSLLNDTRADERGAVLHSTEGWHSDATYLEVSMMGGMIYAEVIPERGGETEIADMATGYDTLPEATREQIKSLCAYHSLEYSNARRSGTFPKKKLDVGSFQTGNVFEGKCYLRPLVREHPETGRKMLLSSLHAFQIKGPEGEFWDKEKSTQFLDELCDHACQHPRTYKHKWTPGEIMIWDQRRCFHRARPYTEGRRIRSTRITGDPVGDRAIDAPEGMDALAEEFRYLEATRPWETMVRESARGGFLHGYDH